MFKDKESLESLQVYNEIWEDREQLSKAFDHTSLCPACGKELLRDDFDYCPQCWLEICKEDE